MHRSGGGELYASGPPQRVAYSPRQQIYHRIINDEESDSGVISQKPRDVDAQYAVMRDPKSGQAFFQRKLVCIGLCAMNHSPARAYQKWPHCSSKPMLS